jgi:2OG-Fe(II) oxygenase superfamily
MTAVGFGGANGGVGFLRLPSSRSWWWWWSSLLLLLFVTCARRVLVQGFGIAAAINIGHGGSSTSNNINTQVQWKGNYWPKRRIQEAEILSSVTPSRWSKGRRTVLFSNMLKDHYDCQYYDLSTMTARPSNNHYYSQEDGTAVANRIQRGESVICLPRAVTAQKCQALAQQCRAVAQARQQQQQNGNVNYGDYNSGVGLLRLPTQAAAHRAAVSKTPFVAAPLPMPIDAMAEDVLLDVVQRIDAQFPFLSRSLFDSTEDSSPLTRLWVASSSSSADDALGETRASASSLIFSSREPAVNVYTTGGEFLPHTDGQTLTLLIPLSTPVVDFEGGGTAFWSSSLSPTTEAQPASAHIQQDYNEPCLVLSPPAGTALLFGGSVRHAGRPVLAGTRVVLVASFSPCPGDAAKKSASSSTTIWEELVAREICDSDEYVWILVVVILSIQCLLVSVIVVVTVLFVLHSIDSKELYQYMHTHLSVDLRTHCV